MLYDLLVIGSGAAGQSAAIYAGRYLLKTILVKGHEWGGETAVASIIENYPGYLKIDGFELMQKMEEQAKSVGVEMKEGLVTSLKKDGDHFVALVDGKDEIQAKTVILATGSRRRRLGMPIEDKLIGKGLSYCTTCDAPLYKGKIVAIIGGGDSSIKGANLAAEYAEKIYLVVRANKLNGEPVNEQRLLQKKNVEILFETEVKEILGSERMEGVVLSKEVNGSTTLKLGGLFVEIGAIPNNDLAKEVGVELDQYGYVEVDPMMNTNVPGIMAAGDLANETQGFKQDIVAASQGSIAATSAYQYVDSASTNH